MSVATASFKDFIKNHTVGVTLVAVFTIIAILGTSLFGQYNSARSGVITRENALVAQYEANQAVLSGYVLKFNETLGIADRQSARLNEILLDAVKGRYDNDGSLQPGTNGSMFSAIAEAYPDLTSTAETYGRVQDLIISGRDKYDNLQVKLVSMVQDYKNFRNADAIRSWVITTFVGSEPTDALTITSGEEVLTGWDALKQIETLIKTSSVQKAYDSGTQDPLIMPED